MSKNEHSSSAQLACKLGAYKNVNSVNLLSKCSRSGHKGLPKLTEHKRSKRHKVLLQLTIVCVIAWGILLLVNYLISTQHESSLMAANTIPTSTNMLMLSELHSIQGIRATSSYVKPANLWMKKQAFRDQLQQIRMHNILRATKQASSTSKPAIRAEHLFTISPATKDLNKADLHKILVKKWENDFKSIKS